MINKILKPGQIFTYHNRVYQVTRKTGVMCPFFGNMDITGSNKIDVCNVCLNKIPRYYYPKLIK